MTDLARLMFAAPQSGGGKTTLTCAFLRAVHRRGHSPVAFKCGPDYIDPMFHSRVLGLPGRNLDLFFTGEDTVRRLLVRHSAGHDLAVLEGVMGYYDGIGDSDRASSWHLAAATATPTVLILEAKGAALSLAAQVRGFREFRPGSNLAALLLNRCTPAQYARLAPLLLRETGLPVLGYLPALPDCAFESRHLGLVTADEIGGLRQKVDALADALEATADLDGLLALAAAAPPLSDAALATAPVTTTRPLIAVARDAAFCFYYQDNLDLLTDLGARLAFFSPLTDPCLPAGSSALYLGGGYPELHAKALADNVGMRRAVAEAAESGMPILGECGGFQYLQTSLDDPDGRSHAMAGVIASHSFPTGGLRRFGYVTLTAGRDNLLCAAGQQIAAHEFHHWDSADTGDCFTARKLDGRAWDCVVARGNLFAGYPHLYFYNNPIFAANFVKAAGRYQQNHGL